MNKFIFEVGDIQAEHQVIYTQFTEIEYLWGYQKAAQLIIQDIKKHRKGCYMNEIIYPLLLIYFHIIECGLKLMIKRLNQHITNDCSFIHVTITADKLLTSHNINELSKTIKKFISSLNKDNLHYIENYSIVDNLVSQFESYDINCFSTRYKFNRYGEVYKFHLTQKGIDLFVLHANVMEFVKIITNYVLSSNFEFCSHNHFSEKIKSEIEQTLKTIKKFLLVIKKVNFEYIFNLESDDNGLRHVI